MKLKTLLITLAAMNVIFVVVGSILLQGALLVWVGVGLGATGYHLFLDYKDPEGVIRRALREADRQDKANR